MMRVDIDKDTVDLYKCELHNIWHEGHRCYQCAYEAQERELEAAKGGWYAEAQIRKDAEQSVDEWKTKERMAIEQAQRFSDEANEMRIVLDENSKLHLSTVRLIARMENELKDAIEERNRFYRELDETRVHLAKARFALGCNELPEWGIDNPYLNRLKTVGCEWVNCRFNVFEKEGGRCTKDKVYIYLHNGDAKCIQKDIDEGKFPK